MGSTGSFRRRADLAKSGPAGVQYSAPRGKKNSGGMTPTISASPSPMFMRRPTMFGSPPKRRIHAAWLSTNARVAEGASSSGRNVRPRRGRARNTSKKLADTVLPDIPNGSALGSLTMSDQFTEPKTATSSNAATRPRSLLGAKRKLPDDAAMLWPGHDDPTRFVDTERLQQHRVDHAEHRGGRADADRQHQHGHGGEAGLATKAAECIPELERQRHGLLPKKRFLRVLRRHGHDRLVNARVPSPAADEADVSEIAAGVGFERVDLRRVVRRDQLHPVPPELPAVGHRVGALDVHQCRFVPSDAATTRRSGGPRRPESTIREDAREPEPSTSWTSPAPTSPSWPPGFTKRSNVLRYMSSVAKYGNESTHTITSKNSAANGNERASAWIGNTPSSTPASRMRLRFSDALNHRSVAQTWTPNSRRKKIEDDARPHPRSSSLMPGRKSSDEANHSLSHNEFAPPLTPARIQSGWYFDERGTARAWTTDYALVIGTAQHGVTVGARGLHHSDAGATTRVAAETPAGKGSAARSCTSSHAFTGTPSPNPVSERSVPMTR